MITNSFFYPYGYPYPDRRLNVRAPDWVELGLFRSAEIPPPLVHTFLDFDFLDPDYEWTVTFEVTGPGQVTGTPVFTGGGEVTYTWLDEDMSASGTYEGVFIVEDVPLHNRQFSSMFRWRVV